MINFLLIVVSICVVLSLFFKTEVIKIILRIKSSSEAFINSCWFDSFDKSKDETDKTINFMRDQSNMIHDQIEKIKMYETVIIKQEKHINLLEQKLGLVNPSTKKQEMDRDEARLIFKSIASEDE